MRRVYFLIVLGSLLTFLSVGCDSAVEESGTNNNDKSDTIPAHTESPHSTPIQVELSMSKAPLLNTPVSLTCTLTLLPGFPIAENTTAEIKLPESVALISGNLNWQGDLKPGEPVSFSPEIIFNEIGHWTITAAAGGDLVTIYLDIGADHSQFGWPPEMPGVTIVEESLILKVDLSISHPPIINEPAIVTCVISSEIIRPNITATILLSSGTELVSGNLEWQGDLEAGVPISFSTQIRFKQTGYNFIGWRVQQAGNEFSWANPRNIDFIIGEESSSFLELTPLPPPPPTTSINLPN